MGKNDMANYIICPRCELNFIDADEQEYCEVCLKELSGAKTFSDDFEEEEMMEETELCPICGENYMRFGEKMCEECKKKSQYEDEATEDELAEDDESWRSYIDDDEPEDLGIEIDEDKNENFVRGIPFEISAASSKVKVFIIPTDEEYMIALDTQRLSK